jgi:flagellar biosynthetic protein FliO
MTTTTSVGTSSGAGLAGGTESLSIAFSFIGVLAVIVLMLWAARFFKKKYNAGGFLSAKNIKIEDVAALSPDSRIAVVRVGKRLFLLGITAGNITNLSELSEDDLPPPPEEDDEGGGKMSFAESFKTVLAQKLSGDRK